MSNVYDVQAQELHRQHEQELERQAEQDATAARWAAASVTSPQPTAMSRHRAVRCPCNCGGLSGCMCMCPLQSESDDLCTCREFAGRCRFRFRRQDTTSAPSDAEPARDDLNVHQSSEVLRDIPCASQAAPNEPTIHPTTSEPAPNPLSAPITTNHATTRTNSCIFAPFLICVLCDLINVIRTRDDCPESEMLDVNAIVARWGGGQGRLRAAWPRWDETAAECAATLPATHAIWKRIASRNPTRLGGSW